MSQDQVPHQPAPLPDHQPRHSLPSDVDEKSPRHSQWQFVPWKKQDWKMLCFKYNSRPVLWGRLAFWFIISIFVLLWAIGVWKWSTYNVTKSIRMLDKHLKPAAFNTTIFDKMLVLSCSTGSDSKEEEMTNFSCWPVLLDLERYPIPLPPGNLTLYIDGDATEDSKNSTNAVKTWTGPKPAFPLDGETLEGLEYDPPWSYKVPSSGMTSWNPWRQPASGYPFDRAAWSQAISATLNGTNLPIIGVAINSYLLNRFAFADSFILEGCSDVSGKCYLAFNVGFERPGLVQFAAVTVLVLNWLVSMSLCALTGDLILAKRVHVLKGTDELAVCFAALFALPAIRTALPGIPSFGCLFDLIGILPNLILISICALSLTIWRIHRKKSQGSQLE